MRPKEPLQFLIDRGFTKYVPTDMHWSPTFDGWYAEVRVHGRHNHAILAVSGNDDCALVRFYYGDNAWDEALRQYNQLTYLQSFKDLEVFNLPWDDPRNNNNGWPGERRLFTRQWWDPQEEDSPSWMLGSHSQLPW